MAAINTPSFQQQQPEDAVKQFLIETLDLKELPKGSLQEILMDGILLCELIMRFSPDECIIKNEGHNKFAYQDNIGQFLRVAESLHIPQSDLFQTVDLLEGKRMQSVISCLLAIKRIMCEKKTIPTRKTSLESIVTGKKSSSSSSSNSSNSSNSSRRSSQVLLSPVAPTATVVCNNNAYQSSVLQISKPQNRRFSSASSLIDEQKISPHSAPTAVQQYLLHTRKKSTSVPYISATSNTNTAKTTTEWSRRTNQARRSLEFVNDTRKLTENKLSKTSSNNSTSVGGYVKSQVQMFTTNNHATVVEPIVAKVRRISSSDNTSEKNTVKVASKQLLAPMPKPSKSTPLVAATNVTVTAETTTKRKTTAQNKMKYYTDNANRKSSLKKMGSCAITVENDDGTSAVYALGKSIGKGQFGEVFGGLNMDTGEYVAIKRIKRNQMDCDDMNEVGVLKHLNNEHIVRYKGFSKDKEYLNIILEYVEMGSLHNNIKAFGKFPEKLAASYTYKILSGLHYLHSKDVIHCDLKAANILTTKSGGLKLTDFGVSLSLKMKDDENTGEPAGTPNWMAPEVIKFAGASAKSDIWSLGCTIVEMLTGKPPYAGMPSFAALYRIVEDDEPPIPKNITLSEDATQFLLACFRKNPEDRPSAYELMTSKWMEPYFNQDQTLLSPSPKDCAMKKSKSETCLDLSSEPITVNTSNDFLTHRFVDYQTYQTGEKCYGCSIRMKRLWIKSCQDCHLKFHPHCLNKAAPCTKGYHIPSTMIKPTLEEKRPKPSKYTPLGPLCTNPKKAYLPIIQPPAPAPANNSNGRSIGYNFYKSEDYVQDKDNARRNLVSSIMT